MKIVEKIVNAKTGEEKIIEREATAEELLEAQENRAKAEAEAFLAAELLPAPVTASARSILAKTVCHYRILLRKSSTVLA